MTDESGRPAGQVGIGVVVPYDFALDRELWRWTPERVALHLTRTPYEDIPVGVEQALTIGDAATVAAATRSVTIVEPAVVAYGCTSGSFVSGRRGEAALREAMVAAGASRAVTTSGALLRAVETLGIDSLAVVTPYPDEVGDRLVAFLAEAGVKVTGSSNMGLTGRIWEVPDEVTARAGAHHRRGRGRRGVRVVHQPADVRRDRAPRGRARPSGAHGQPGHHVGGPARGRRRCRRGGSRGQRLFAC